MNSLLRRYREAAFVMLFMALPIFVYVLRDQKRWLDRGLITLTAPIEHAIVTVVGGISDVWGHYVWLVSTREQDAEMRREMLREQAKLQVTSELVLENARLRTLLDLADKSAPLRLLAAPVVAVGASPHSHTLRIGRGSNDGVQQGAAVIAPDGVVGTITQITAGYSDVQLIVAPQAAVPAVSARTRGRSTVSGMGDLSRCRLDYALRTDELQDGDTLVTAGGSGLYPKGLRIGRVIDVQKRATGMFIGAEVVPAVDFTRLDEVMVVLGQPGEMTALPVEPRAVEPSRPLEPAPPDAGSP